MKSESVAKLNNKKKVIVCSAILVAIVTGWGGYYAYASNYDKNATEFIDYIERMQVNSMKYILDKNKDIYKSLKDSVDNDLKRANEIENPKNAIKVNQKTKLNNYASISENNEKKKLSLDEAMNLIIKADSKIVTPEINKGGRLNYNKESTPEVYGITGIKEKTYFFFLEAGTERYVIGTYLVGIESGNVYKGPSNGDPYFDLLKSGKAVKRYN